MKKALFFFFLSALLLSCSRKDIDLMKPSKAIDNLDAQTLASVNDSIVQLDSTQFPKKKKNLARRYDYPDVYTYLYDLNGMEFYIQAKDNSSGRNTLQTNGQGRELTLQPYAQNNTAQLFYFRFLPPSTGVQYMIYSAKERTPIGIGSYRNNPGRYVLYNQRAGSTSYFGFGWEPSLNTDRNAYYLQSNDIMGTGSGGPYDIFYYVLNAQNGNILFTKKDNSYYQHFNIIPNDEFLIEDISYDILGGEVTEESLTSLSKGTVVNGGSQPLQRTLELSESVSNESSFTETNGVSTKITANASVGLKFKIVEIGTSFTIETAKERTVQYGANKTITRTITNAFNLTVPPNTISTFNFQARQHKVRVNYTARCRGIRTGKVITISGVYTGIEYSSTIMEVRESPISRSGVTRTYMIQPN
ncbi:hypothetical protein [Elizabethkingia anophelis]|uniref:Uncharacterized protein n=1 Tax=Elizabethkingia anophelis TaxID=1117645 RepID=A0A494J5Q7_9FLAO|nr:hypothetical protein [Elizabethkingia anophelis]AQX50873.1 hypothetical protein AYC66_09335 [Elizabethkingia anophelis]MCT4197198.1 hypothetical protein [Elizabethkingia anophelis]MCT4224858.1 hypothetical protein [Elizabethkingia anophelis]MCT4306449.1 hypothetical protein [Elizabethkingia anophelis]MDV2472229.1 hypothetical protein [Elizabethkingia anophelis]